MPPDPAGSPPKGARARLLYLLTGVALIGTTPWPVSGRGLLGMPLWAELSLGCMVVLSLLLARALGRRFGGGAGS